MKKMIFGAIAAIFALSIFASCSAVDGTYKETLVLPTESIFKGGTKTDAGYGTIKLEEDGTFYIEAGSWTWGKVTLKEVKDVSAAKTIKIYAKTDDKAAFKQGDALCIGLWDSDGGATRLDTWTDETLLSDLGTDYKMYAYDLSKFTNCDDGASVNCDYSKLASIKVSPRAGSGHLYIYTIVFE
jgi:hypothetical protein